MLIKTMITQKQDFNKNFELNGCDVRYSDYQTVILSSVISGIPIESMLEKNRLYYLTKKFKKVRSANMNMMNLDITFSKMLNNDRKHIATMLDRLSASAEEDRDVVLSKKILGVWGILIHDYR